MGKQYTFKTTRDTQWLEPILDALASNERSMTIRESLTLYFDDQRPAVTRQTKVTPKVPLELPKETPKVTPVRPLVGSIEPVGQVAKKPRIIEPVIESVEVDLDSALDNLDF